MKKLLLFIFISSCLWGQSTTPNLGMTWPAHGAPNWDSNVVGNATIIDNVFTLPGNCAFTGWNSATKRLTCGSLASPGPIGQTTPDVANFTALSVASCLGCAGLNDVRGYARGIAIGDGSAHTVSTAPVGTLFNGVTTLTQLAGLTINGATPFSWVNAAPFTGSGAYNLTNTDVPNLDIAWLAIQAALITGKTYIPAGTYIIGSVKALPLYIPLSDFAAGVFEGTPTAIYGDGPGVTVLKAGSDFGAGVPLIACGDPAGTSGNLLGRYSGNNAQCNGTAANFTLHMSGAGSIYPATGTTPIAMTGFAWGARLALQDIWSQGFGKDISLVGDHTKWIRVHPDGGTIGIEWDAPNVNLLGDVTFDDLLAEGQSIASISVNSGATMSGAVFTGETYLSAPVGIRAESGACTSLMSNVSFDHLFDEFMGNALISDETGLSGGVWTDSNKCRNVINLHINKWFQLYSNSKLWTTGGRGRRATIDAAQINMVVDMMSGAGANMAPTSPGGGASPVATFNVNKFSVDGFGGTKLGGDLLGWRNQNTSAGLGIPLWVSAFGDHPYQEAYNLYQGPEIDLSDTAGILNGAIGFYDHNGTGVLAKLTGPDNANVRTNPIVSTNYFTLPGLNLTNVASGTQCLHANSSGFVTGSGSDCTGAATATYYVDNCVVTGNDSNNGTSPSTPWLTVAKVNGVTFNAGDSILFQSGCTWREALTPPSSGSLGKQITFSRYGTGPKPIITGFNVVSSLTLNTGTVYNKTSFTTAPGVVEYNGQLLFYNHVGTSITSGQWDWAANVLYVNVGTNPSAGVVEAGQRNYAIDVVSKSFITIDGLQVTGGTITGVFLDTAAANVIVQNVEAHHSLQGISTASDCGNFNLIQKNTTHDTVQYGINVFTTGTNENVLTNEIYNAGGKGAPLSDVSGIFYHAGAGAIVSGNYIHDGGDDSSADHGIYFAGTNCTTATCSVDHNQVSNWSACGIKISNSQHVDVYGNLITGGGGSGQITVESGSPSFVNIYNNTIANTLPGAYGIWVTAGDHIKTRNNVIYNVNYTGNQQSEFNIYVLNSPTNLDFDYDSIFDPTPTSGGTVYYGYFNGTPQTWAGIQGLGYELHGLNVDPLLASPSTGDLRPTALSSVLNVGQNLGAPYNIGLSTATFWPYAFKDQNSFNTTTFNWNMGAYVYDPAASVPKQTFLGNTSIVKGGNGGYWQSGSLTELVTLATGATTTDSFQNLLPANSVIRAVTGRVTTTITAACTGWKLGDATTAGRFTANDTTLTANETKVGLLQADQTGAGGPIQAAAAKVRITCAGGNPGAGVVRVTSFFDQFVGPTQ